MGSSTAVAMPTLGMKSRKGAAEDAEPQVEADEAEHARVHERDEQRDAHLAPDVAEDRRSACERTPAPALLLSRSPLSPASRNARMSRM